MAKRITPEEINQATALLPVHGIRGTAAILHRAPAAISDIAHRIEGLDVNGFAAKRGAEAASLLAKERRLGLLSMVADHVEAQLLGQKPMISAKDLRDLSVSLGVAIDKQRLEEGLSSANLESHITAFTVRELPPK